MKLLIVSDSHGNTRYFSELLARRRGQDDALLFLGDGCADAEELVAGEPGLSLYCVAGNGEEFLARSCPWEREQLLSLGGVRILMIHGHRLGVSGGYETAVAYAQMKGADVLLFGHTHVRLETYLPGTAGTRPLYVFNPGSISRPRDGSPPSFGTLELREDGLLFGHGSVGV